MLSATRPQPRWVLNRSLGTDEGFGAWHSHAAEGARSTAEASCSYLSPGHLSPALAGLKARAKLEQQLGQHARRPVRTYVSAKYLPTGRRPTQ